MRYYIQKSNKLILTIYFYLIGISILAQPIGSIKLNHYSGSHKIPGESIQCIYQDKIGVLWLATESLGLTKYDGETCTVFSSDPINESSITSNFVVRIVEDKKGFIWVATINGLNKLDRHSETFTRFIYSANNQNSLSDNIIRDMIIDDNGFIWIATLNGITILNPEREEFIRVLNNPDKRNLTQNIDVNTVYNDKNGNIWIGSSIHGLYFIKKDDYLPVLQQWQQQSALKLTKSITKIDNWKSELDKLNIRSINALSTDNSGILWIGGQEGLYYFNPQTEVFSKWLFKKLSYNKLNLAAYHCLLVDSENNLWAGTSNNGLIVIDLEQKSYQSLDAEDNAYCNLKSNAIRDLIESEDGTIWISTKFKGLHYYDKRQHTFPLVSKGTKEMPGLNDMFAISALEDLNHNIWIGTKTGGVNKYNRKLNSFEYFTADGEPGSIKSNRIEALATDSRGTIWIGTQMGLESTHPDTLRFRYHVPKHVRKLLYTSDDNLWLGTTTGLFRFSCKSMKLNPIPSKHSSFFDIKNNISISKMYEDSNGVLWIATFSNGLFEYHYSTDSLINHLNDPVDSSSISGNQIRSIYESSDKKLWIGTKSSGLNYYDRHQKNFIRITDYSDLSLTTIYNILEDKAGNLWMGTHNGIIEYNPTNRRSYNYTTVCGLQGAIFETNCYCTTHDGLFLMGGHNGFNLFNPLKVKYKTNKHPIIISKISVNNQPILRDIYSFKSINLEKTSNYLSFEFSLLDYTNTDENIYAYKLVPFDKEWIHTGTRNFASYTNLPPGEYTFYVKGSNNTVIWNEDAPLAVEIIIPTPFWKHWWFTALIILLIITIVILTNHIRLKAALKRETLLTQLVKKRTKDLVEAYKKLEESNKKIEAHNRKLRIQRDQISSQNKELENHRHHLEVMVSTRTLDLERAKRKAEESDRLKSAFLANMSHEIRTPLNAIIGFIDLMKAGQIKKEEEKNIHEIIQSNGHSLLQLINDIIDISIIEANQVVIIKRSIEFNKFLTEINTQYYANKELLNGNIKLVLSLPDSQNGMMMHTAPDRVHQIYINLINNALKFTEKGAITFGYTLSSDKNKIICFVKDSGCGISKENQKRLFERFMKIDVDQSKIHRGTGLGLSISKNLCELLGGEIWVESEPEKGSEFYFTLPCDSAKE